MGTSVKRLVRDRLVNDSSIRGFLNVTTTASAPVSPVYMESTGIYPRIIYSEILGRSEPGISAVNGLITFSIENQATGGVNPHITMENIAERIDQLFDDQPVTGLAISGTAVYSCLFLREGGAESIFDDQTKIYRRFINYSYKALKY